MTTLALSDPVERKLLLERKKQLLGQRALLQRDFGLCFYRPDWNRETNGFGGGPQDRFHRAGNFKYRLWEAGNRSGKSTAGVAEDSAFLLGERPWLPASDPARKLGIPDHPCKGLVICADWDKVDEIFTSERGTSGKLWSYLPRGFVRSKRRNHSGAIELVECINGSTLRFDTVKSFSTNPLGSESSDWDFIHGDEPCSREQFIAQSRGLIDRNGKVWFTLTALTEPWIHDMFFPSRRMKDVLRVDGTKWAQRSSTYDNKTLTTEAIAEFEGSLTEDEKLCRIHGIPLELSGMVYKEFSWEKHVLQDLPLGWSAYNDPPLDYTIYIAIDPHPQTPHAVMFLAVAPTGEWFVYDEVYVHCTVAELSKHILARLVKRVEKDKKFSEHPRFNPCTIVDPYAFNTFPVLNAKSGKHLCMADEFLDNGIFLTKATKALEQGILAVKHVLKEENRVYFSPHCEETITQLTHYAWDTKENKPKDEYDHFAENFYRLVLEQPRYISPDSTKPINVPELSIERPDFDLPDFSLD